MAGRIRIETKRGGVMKKKLNKKNYSKFLSKSADEFLNAKDRDKDFEVWAIENFWYGYDDLDEEEIKIFHKFDNLHDYQFFIAWNNANRCRIYMGKI